MIHMHPSTCSSCIVHWPEGTNHDGRSEEHTSAMLCRKPLHCLLRLLVMFYHSIAWLASWLNVMVGIRLVVQVLPAWPCLASTLPDDLLTLGLSNSNVCRIVVHVFMILCNRNIQPFIITFLIGILQNGVGNSTIHASGGVEELKWVIETSEPESVMQVYPHATHKGAKSPNLLTDGSPLTLNPLMNPKLLTLTM